MKKKRVSSAKPDKENPEWTREDFKQARPASDVLPEIFGAKNAEVLLKRKPGQRGPQKTPVKQPVMIRLDQDIVNFFKSGGRGWQSRMNDALRGVVESSF